MRSLLLSAMWAATVLLKASDAQRDYPIVNIDQDIEQDVVDPSTLVIDVDEPVDGELESAAWSLIVSIVVNIMKLEKTKYQSLPRLSLLNTPFSTPSRLSHHLINTYTLETFLPLIRTRSHPLMLTFCTLSLYWICRNPTSYYLFPNLIIVTGAI